MLVRLCKIGMLVGLSLYAFLVTFNNLTDYGTNFVAVQHVLSMDTVISERAASYRAITAEWVWHLAYWGIILGEGLTSVLLFAGAWRLFQHRLASGDEFNRHKGLAVLGASVGFAVWFGLFMIVAGEWFLMWQSPDWNVQDAAFYIYMTILAVLIFVMQPDRDL